MRNSHWFVVLLLLLICGGVHGDAFTGWRGNGTGLYPDAVPLLEWHRTPQGALDGLRAQTGKPNGDKPSAASLIEKGLVREWLVLGPFPVGDAVKDFDHDPLKGVATIEPNLGDKFGERVWTKVEVPPDDISVFGTAELPWLDVGKAVGFKLNQLAYAHAYLYSPRGGKARIVVDHGEGLKAWVNGKEVYRTVQRTMGLGYYTSLSRIELNHSEQTSPRFDIELKAGWNRLLLKFSSPNKEGFKDMRCAMRLIESPDVRYESKNIRWMTPLPGRSTSTPIVVGDKVFVLAEPDELLCLDKISGKILWSAFVNYYEALSADERKKHEDYAKVVDPLIAKLTKEPNRARRTKLRGQIQDALLKIDRSKFAYKGSGHFESHFGIVGFTMPTPVSDGKRVYVWSGMGVAACWDLDGKRQWITRIDTHEINYGSSPALVDGVLVVFLNNLYGLDAKSGKLLWDQPKVKYNVAALIGTKLAGKPVVVTQRGDVIRPSDGEPLFWQRESGNSGDTGWSPPVVLGDRVYSPKYGVTGLRVFDFTEVKETPWKPKTLMTLSMPPEVSRNKKGGWLDRWTAGSPLVHDGLVYQVDIYQELFVSDEKTGKLVYRQELDLHGLTHYNAVAVAASPALVGKHIFVGDNQGTTLVLEPGRKFKMVAKNRIATQMDRGLAIPGQETIGYAPVVADGERLYIRGEGHLYCVAK